MAAAGFDEAAAAPEQFAARQVTASVYNGEVPRVNRLTGNGIPLRLS